jgi:simple sugar transport system permease protein
LVLLAAACVVGTWFVVFRTPFGLRLRSVGEHPRAADTVGINVFRMRYIAVLISGALAGIGGAFISYNVSSYTENMVAGNGFIALAALIFGKWRPVPVLLACLLFGFSQGLASRLSGVGWLPDALQSPELLNSLPYVITLVALAGFVGRSVPPAAVGKPYSKH